jgi:hypothetical protein
MAAVEEDVPAPVPSVTDPERRAPEPL